MQFTLKKTTRQMKNKNRIHSLKINANKTIKDAKLKLTTQTCKQMERNSVEKSRRKER